MTRSNRYRRRTETLIDPDYPRSANGDVPDLTQRQRQCLEGFIARKTAKQIGRELGITHHAVEQHFKAARKKLGCNDTLAAARRYVAGHDTTVERYYATPDVPSGPDFEQGNAQLGQGSFLLRDIATDRPAWVQPLSAQKTLIAIGLCGLGMISILALIVAVANGVAQLALGF